MTQDDLKARWFARLGYRLPNLEREGRKALLERVEVGSHGGVDFIVMMVLSSGLASLGLLEGSTAVVIGAMLALVLLLPLMLNVEEQKRRGQSEPLTYPVAAHVYEAVVDYIGSIPGVTLVTIGRVSAEPVSSVSILLATRGNVPAGIKEDLTRLVHEVRGGTPIVRIINLREVGVLLTLARLAKPEFANLTWVDRVIAMRFLLFCLFICALPSPSSAQEVTVLPGYDEAIEWMESIDWWGENSRAKQLTVPRTLLIGISPRWREQAPQMPVAQKKEFFYRCLLPLVVHANTMVLDRRDRLAGLDGLLSRGKMAPARIVEQKKSGEFEKKTRTYASRVTDHQHL